MTDLAPTITTTSTGCFGFDALAVGRKVAVWEKYGNLYSRMTHVVVQVDSATSFRIKATRWTKIRRWYFRHLRPF
jgi:hypothetical protein